MRIQQIRNATLKIQYGTQTILLDPWLQDKGTGFSAKTVNTDMAGIKNPMNDLPMPVSIILDGVDFCLVTHIHPDHFTPDYLPKDLRILVQNDGDATTARQMGFANASAVSSTGTSIGTVKIIRTPAVHGDSAPLAERMGEASGFILQGEAKTLYIAGDTVYYDGVRKTIEQYHPDVIVLNCCAATVPAGRLIMNLEDMSEVCKIAPEATIIATHLDSVNHATVTSADVTLFAAQNRLGQIRVPANGESIEV